jgi:hypothetical protein
MRIKRTLQSDACKDSILECPFLDPGRDRRNEADKIEFIKASNLEARTGTTETGGQPLTERRHSVGYVHPTFCRTDGQNVHGTQRSK